MQPYWIKLDRISESILSFGRLSRAHLEFLNRHQTTDHSSQLTVDARSRDSRFRESHGRPDSGLSEKTGGLGFGVLFWWNHQFQRDRLVADSLFSLELQ